MRKPIKKHGVRNISDWDRAKSMLILLEIRQRLNPEEHVFYWPEEKMLSIHSDQFEMERVFQIIKKETNGNVEAKYETTSLFSESTGSNLHAIKKIILMRIKDKEKFIKDYKRIDGKKEKIENNQINKIEIIEKHGEEKLRVYINEDCTNEKIRPNKKGLYWGKLLELINNGNVDMVNDKKAREMVDFFNTNKNNILYKRSSYSLSNIITRDGNTISSVILIEFTTENKIERRKNLLKTA